MANVDIDLGGYKLGWSDSEDDYVFKPEKGLNEEIIREMSRMKEEPQWMLDFRLKAYKRFLSKPMPDWGGTESLAEIDFDDIYYYVKPTDGQAQDWDMVPDSIKETYEKLGIPEAERKFLAGVTAQYESEVVYHRNREDLEELGVLFMDMDSAVRDHPEIVQEYFGSIIPPNDNKFAALNSAVWSGGSFIYVPPGVHVDQPLQAYFRINAENMGQFETHADHHRRGCVLSLRRGLLRSCLHDRFVALGRGGDRRQEGRALPLFDDSELVEQRLQPRHQTGRRLRERHHGMG